MEIWVEEVFISNLLMNTIILLLCKQLLGLKTSTVRILLVATCTAIIGVLFAVQTNDSVILIAKIALALGMTLLASPSVQTKKVVLHFFVLLFVTALLGGIGYAVIHTLDAFQILNGQMFIKHPLLLSLVYLLSFLAYLMTKNLIKVLKTTWLRSGNVFTVCLEEGNQKAVIEAFLDTGNCLTDPETLQPIMIVSLHVFEQLYGVSAAIQLYLKNYHQLNLNKQHFVEVAGVGNSSKLLVFELSRVVIANNYLKKELLKPLVGVTMSSLNHLNCGCILNPQMLI